MHVECNVLLVGTFTSDMKYSTTGHKAWLPLDILRAKAQKSKKSGPQLLISNERKISVPFKARELKVNLTETLCVYEYY